VSVDTLVREHEDAAFRGEAEGTEWSSQKLTERMEEYKSQWSLESILGEELRERAAKLEAKRALEEERAARSKQKRSHLRSIGSAGGEGRVETVTPDKVPAIQSADTAAPLPVIGEQSRASGFVASV